MILYQKEKIDNAISYFAREHHKKTQKYLPQTFLYKYLAFLDFKSLKTTGRMALELEYVAMQRGPVPPAIYNKRDKLKTELYEFRNCGEDKYIIISKKDPNMDYFSKTETKLMSNLIEIFADQYVSANDISDASHEDITAWKKTWSERPNTMIDPALTFNGNLSDKKEDDLTFSEECFLTYNAIVGHR